MCAIWRRWQHSVAVLGDGRARFIVVIWAIMALIAAEYAVAQMYAFDPSNPPGNANVYFGSTKDRDGNFLDGVTVRLEVGQVTYVMVTDDAGRFKIEVSKEVEPSQVKFLCSKPGYIQVRATKRPPPNHALSPIQADCVLDRRGEAVK
jgi:hypothetical protein